MKLMLKFGMCAVGVWLFIILAIGVGWIKNVIKLSECDFNSPYKAEIIHGIGLVPIVGAFTGWMDVGK